MMQPTDKLTVELEAQQWQQVVEVLADGKFRVVMSLIQAIQKQLMAAESQQANQPGDVGMRVPGGMNGAEAPHE